MRQYIYGVISASQTATFGQSFLTARPETVDTIVHRDLAGVASNYHGNDFTALSRENQLRCLIAHQQVIERVMKEQTILPVKFGTLVADEDEIRHALEQGYQQFIRTLHQMRGFVEIEIAATWDLPNVLGEIGHEAKIRQLRYSLAGKSSSAIREIQIKAGRLVKESLERRREDYLNQMQQALTGIAREIQPKTPLTEEMVMNVAVLIPKEKLADFNRQMRRLNQAGNNQINFRIIGPLPPYSFSTVAIKRPDPARIEEARQLLGLGTTVSAKQLKESYRRLAAQSHPDTHPANTSHQRFTRVREAFVLLKDYCQGQVLADSQGYSLMPADVRQTLLIEIKPPALRASGTTGIY